MARQTSDPLLSDLGYATRTFRKKVGASSCSLYIRDPIWTDEYYLAAWPGVRMPESMRGFGAQSIGVIGGGPECVVVQRRDQSTLKNPPPHEFQVHESVRQLAGDFVEREQVESALRLKMWSGDSDREVVLFVNFREQDRIDTHLIKRSTAFLKTLPSPISAARARIKEFESAICFPQFVRLAAPIHSPLYQHLKSLAQRKRYFDHLAEAVLDSLQVDPASGVATIHMLDRKARMLRLAGAAGSFDDAAAAKAILLEGGRGIVSWVAHMRTRSVLIENLKSSAFRSIHIPILKRAASEVAIPILVGDEFVGVLNVESRTPGQFSALSIRALWYAAAKAALAQRIFETSRTRDALLGLCQQATRGGADITRVLNNLANIAAEQASASQCEVWLKAGREFSLRAATTKVIDQPRARGWTRLVQDAVKAPIWLTTPTVASSTLDARAWQNDQWVEVPIGEDLNGARVPKDLHPTVAQTDYVGHLGVPVKLGSDVKGVAWFRYRRRTLPLTDVEMRTVNSFIEQLGVAAEIVEAPLYTIEKDRAKRTAARINDQLLQTDQFDAVAEMNSPFVDVACRTASCDPDFTGDFFGLRILDEDHVGVLLGDGEGHGLIGALNMWRMLMAFHRELEDLFPRVTLNKVAKVCRTFTARGTALYAVVRRLAKDKHSSAAVSLSVAAAGHPGVIIVRNDLIVRKDFPATKFRSGMLGESLVAAPTDDQKIDLESGSVAVAVTDGILDRLSVEGTIRVIKKHSQSNASAIADAILTAAKDARKVWLGDDATVLVLRVL